MSFRITNHAGFQMSLPNGWTVSVQFGAGNYSSNRHSELTDARRSEFWESKLAEIAAWYGEREGISTSNWYNFGNDGQVKGYCPADEVVEFLGMVSKLPSRRLRVADYEASNRHDVPVAPV